MIQVSESAAEAIKSFMADKNLTSALRVMLQSGGWGGPSLRLVLDEPKENDETYEKDNVTYLIDKELSSQSGDIEIDFVDNGWQKGFMITSANPVSDGGGGCTGCTSCW